MTDTTILRSVRTTQLVVVLGVVVCFAGVYFVFYNNPGGWYLIIPGVATTVAGILGMRDRKPRIILAPQGLEIRELGNELIPWEHIESVDVQWLPRAGDFIILNLVDGEKRKFYAAGLEVSAQRLRIMIQKRINDNSDQVIPRTS